MLWAEMFSSVDKYKCGTQQHIEKADYHWGDRRRRRSLRAKAEKESGEDLTSDAVYMRNHRLNSQNNTAKRIRQC